MSFYYELVPVGSVSKKYKQNQAENNINGILI